MTGDGGKLEQVGGSSEKKVRIVGGFTWWLLIGVLVVLLAVIAVIFLGQGKTVPSPSTTQSLNRPALVFQLAKSV
jgi:hypothetical protein